MTRFVVCGEALIDLVPSGSGHKDSFRSGWEALSAGSPMNSAEELGKQGARVHLRGRITPDALGRQAREPTTRAAVELDLATESSQATSIAVVSLDDEGVPSYTFR